MDFCLKFGLFLNSKDKTAHLYNGGDISFSTSTLEDAGKSVVGVLKHPEETKNRAVYVQSVQTTQNKLLGLAKKATGEAGWKVDEVSIQKVLDGAWAELKSEKLTLRNLPYHLYRFRSLVRATAPHLLRWIMSCWASSS